MMLYRKYLLILICGVALFAGFFTSCQLDEPGPIPSEELYLRAFIKKYGLIDPNQDWNQAERTSVTVVVDYAKLINVFIKCADAYYRVATLAEVNGTVEIPLDVPEGTDTVYLDIDGTFFMTAPGSTVDTTSRSGVSRAGEDYSSYLSSWQPWWEDAGVHRYSIDIPTASAADYTHFYLGESYVDNPPVKNEKNPNNVDDNYHFSMALHDKVYFQLHNTSTKATNFFMTFETTVATYTKLYIKGGEVSTTLELSGTQSHTVVLNNIKIGTWPQFGLYVPEGAITSFGNFQVKEFEPQDMAWLMVAEDLGATDDFDFNDVIIRIESLTTNKASLSLLDDQWAVVGDDNTHIVLNSRASGASRAETYTQLRITAMCAGGVLDSYLHFNDGTNDFVISPPAEASNIYDLTNASTNAGGGEWHSWFNESFPSITPNNRNMINTGYNSAAGKSATVVVPGGFSMTNYSVLYKDYDETKDSFDGSNYNYNGGSSNWTDDWDYDYSGATYDAGDKIVGFYITVGGSDPLTCNSVLTAPKKGRAPQMFLIPDAGWEGYWHWPMERVPITTVYPRFYKWVGGTDIDWYVDEPAAYGETVEKVDKWAKPYFVRK